MARGEFFEVVVVALESALECGNTAKTHAQTTAPILMAVGSSERARCRRYKHHSEGSDLKLALCRFKELFAGRSTPTILIPFVAVFGRLLCSSLDLLKELSKRHSTFRPPSIERHQCNRCLVIRAAFLRIAREGRHPPLQGSSSRT